MCLIPLGHQVCGGLADVGPVHYLCAELGAVVQRSQHGGVGAEEDVELAIHADGGCKGPQPIDLHRLPGAVRLQDEIPQ